MRESRAEDDVIADIAAEELEAYLGSHLVTDNYSKMAAKDIPFRLVCNLKMAAIPLGFIYTQYCNIQI